MNARNVIIATVVALSALFAFSLPASAARPPAPMPLFEDIAAVDGSGKPATVEQIKAALRAGPTRRGWVFSDLGPDSMSGRLNVRTHQIEIDLALKNGSFSVNYRDSVNMQFVVEYGQKMIHPQYGNWVNNLLLDVRTELAKQ